MKEKLMRGRGKDKMPLKLKSSHLALLYFLKEKKILDEICHHFHSKHTAFNFHNPKDTIWNILLHQLNNNQSNHHSNHKSIQYLQFKLNMKPNKHPLYNLLLSLSLEFFEIKRGRNILQVHKIEDFQLLQNSIHMTPIYALSISEYIKDFHPTKRLEYLKNSIKNNSIPLPHRFLSIKHFSDNHFHLGGGNNFTYRLHQMLQTPEIVSYDEIPDNYKLYAFKKIKERKFIVFATSILEKLIISQIIQNSQESETHVNFDLFNNFAKAMQHDDFTLLNEITNYSIDKYHAKDDEDNNDKQNDTKDENADDPKENKNEHEKNTYFLYSIRPKYHQTFFNHIQTRNYHTQLIYLIVQHNLKHEIHKADIILWVLLSDILRNEGYERLKDFIFMYLSLRNILHTFIIQEQNKGGLEYFSSYSKSSLRRDKKAYELDDTFSSILDKNYTFYIEGRMIFHQTEHAIAEDVLKWFKAFIKSSLEITHVDNKLKFMLHYKKNQEQDQRTLKYKISKLSPRYELYRKKIFQQSQIFLDFLSNQRYKSWKIYLPIENYTNHFLEDLAKENQAISEIKKDENHIIVNLHELISGIDAASLEYNTPPEVFAPIYNYVKQSNELLHKTFQFSFHTGEDTEDIVSSLRRILETIVFLDLKKGDRLGHALSLGFSYKKESLEIDNILTTQECALNNAIFLYFLFYSLYYAPDRHKYLVIFEQQILLLGSKIYNSSYTINQHINAWMLRRNSPLVIKNILDGNITEYESKKYYKKSSKFLQRANIELFHQNKHLYKYKLFLKYAGQDIFKLTMKNDNFYTDRYASARNDTKAWELLLKYHFSKKVREKGAKQIEESPYSSEIIEITQDLIMEHVIAKNDIIVEVMPTSNILNSQIESYTQHPLFRFKPVDGNLETYNQHGIRKTPLKIIINTDNPGFQATSYLNELFLINEAAIKIGYNHKDIEKYINEIVELGNRIFTGTAAQE
jgi:hypothetical protein